MDCRIALGKICEFFRGASVPRARMHETGDALYIHYGDLYRGFKVQIDIESPQKAIPFISSDEKVRDNQLVKDKDIIYVLTSETVNDLGYSFLINNPEGKKVVAGTETTIVRVTRPDLLMPDYLNWLFQTERFKRLLRQYIKGMKVFRVHPDDIARIEINIPSLDVQRRIVAVADSLFDREFLLGRINDYLAEHLKSYAKRLYREYERDEGADLPEGWHWTTIGEISKMVCRGITPKYNDESDELILGQTCIRNNLVLLENGRLHAPRKITEKWLKKYDLLINSTGVGSLGRTAQVWFDPSKLVVDSHVTIVRAADPRHALYMGFWAFEHERYIESLHTGSTGQTELPRDHVKAIRLVLPSDAELEKFNAVAQPAVELIVANQKESKRLAELRDTLLPKLMSGEIDVSSVVIKE